MKFLSILFCSLTAAVNVFSADKWGAFSDPFPIYDAIPHGDDGVMLATEGGIRYRTVNGDFVFHSEHGLETSNFRSIVSGDLGVFAVSEFGMVAALNPSGNSWRILNRSYVSNNVQVVAGAAAMAKNILVIPFEDRLAFFDLLKGSSIYSLERIGSLPLSVSPIQSTLIRGDSLYLKTGRGIYGRQMHWDSLSTDLRLSDPASWIELPKQTRIEEFDLQESPKVVVEGVELKDSILYNDTIPLIKWSLKTKTGYFLVGSNTVAFYNPQASGKKLKDLSYYERYSLGEVYELQAISIGGILAASVDGKLGYVSTDHWSSAMYPYGGIGVGPITAYDSRVKVLSSLPDGHVFYHTWGFAYHIYSDWLGRQEYFFRSTEKHCFDNYLENYAVSTMSIPAPDGSGFITATASNNGYSIVYFTKDGEVHCAKQVSQRSFPGAMYATIDKDGSWLLYVASRLGSITAESGGIDVIKFPSPKSNGGVLADGVLTPYSGLSLSAIDMAFDSSNKRLWIITSFLLGYLDDETHEVKFPTSANGLLGAEYTSLDVDVHGNLWLGTSNQGVYRLTPKKSSPDTLSVMRFTSKNGLLSDGVADVAIDPVLGIAWFAHEKGISYYQRNDLKDAHGNMTDSAKVKVRAYPIPFRPKEHACFTIDGIAEDAVVSLFNRGGALVKSFRNGDVVGGKVEWDGRDKTGKLVAPGVYYYVVNASSKIKKGKFIIAH